MSAPIKIVYYVHTSEGGDYMRLQREVMSHVIPTPEMLVDFTPRKEKTDPKLLFRVAGPIELRHAEPGHEELVCIDLGRACVPEDEQPDAEFLQRHGFVLVRGS